MDEQQKKLLEELLFSGPKKPSFGKMLYFGILDDSQIFPYPSTPEDAAFQAEVKRFAEEQIDGAAIDRLAAIPESLIQGLGQLGVLGMTIPKEYGGLDLTQRDYCKAIEIVSRRCGATALFINAHQSIGLKALLLFGTDKQKERWLKPLATGKAIAAFALTEPNAGSDANGIETRAIYDKEKKVYRVSGRKQWITNGSMAQVLTVMAKTEVQTPSGKEDKVTAFLVTPDMPGFIVEAAALEKVGMRGSKTAILRFDNVEVPEENILGPLGGGLKVCLTVLDYGRTTFGATCTGAAKFLLEKSVEQAKNRYQFKRPLASFGLVKEKLAKMKALIYAMDATTYMTAGLVDKKVEDFMLELAILKVFTSEALWQIIYDTMQIYGGRSFFTDAPFERMMRDGRLNMIGEGSNEVMRVFIGVVGMRDVGFQFKNFFEALQNPLENKEVLYHFMKQKISAFKTPKIPTKSPELSKESASLGSSIRSFGFNVAKLLGKYREDIVEEQLVLNRIANMAIAIYTSASVLSKLDTDLLQNEEHKSSTLKLDLGAGKLYCQIAQEVINTNHSLLFQNGDAKFIQLADLMTKSGYKV